MRMNEAVRTDIDNAVLCWLATVSAEGMPNVTPKEIFDGFGDDKIVIADIASSNSVANIQGNPAACVSFIDIFRQRGFKITGQARIVSPDASDFEALVAGLRAKAGPAYPIRNVIVLDIERIARLWAPSYRLKPEETEADKMQAAYATYGVRPRLSS